ncbi:hypothetical protein FP74_gp028 [Bacillus phage CAM003]|uniref:Uncharacterized protein n=4 Tax=Bastillevirus TaxID=1918010 RepID=A0A024B197_9CAUD|nr:hypothetical protein FP73_gp026 [Bacillus phage Hoody T]YP_009035550.1 hypothetical protein FP76_gp029 [Bacillus phage Evoli]YP_009036931.1 hypothetical protein FP74_gp028 [Bacillus phage CAM003]ASU00877.1 hypothetical protein ANTHONY_30 [Bacillus phage Anthony]AHZ09465.1 hypothetical protein [Bacillus phage CAM003]AHZ09753.1 hypothetical protein [Bacillus phage Evoli]AHZ10338.1 hypothetical protein [Bacillus phage Hoody T]
MINPLDKAIKSLERKYDRQEMHLQRYEDIIHNELTDREFRILERGMHLGNMNAYDMSILVLERLKRNGKNNSQ